MEPLYTSLYAPIFVKFSVCACVGPEPVNVQTLRVLGVPDMAVLRCDIDHVQCFILHLPYIVSVYSMKELSGI